MLEKFSEHLLDFKDYEITAIGGLDKYILIATFEERIKRSVVWLIDKFRNHICSYFAEHNNSKLTLIYKESR